MARSRVKEHQWTRFELQAMLSLIMRQTHIAERPTKRTESSEQTSKNTYEKFATRLNEALHGKHNFHKDINKHEITRMLDSLLAQRINVVGKGGLMERQPVCRITRALRLAWERSDFRNFTGSEEEWKAGRREKVIKADMIRRGIPPPEPNLAEVETVVPIAARSQTYTSEQREVSENHTRVNTGKKQPHQMTSVGNLNDKSSHLFRQLDKIPTAATSKIRSVFQGRENTLSSNYIGKGDDGGLKIDTMVSSAATQNRDDEAMTKLASFALLPAHVRESSRYNWVTGKETPSIRRVGEKGEVIKLMRPSRNASRTDGRGKLHSLDIVKGGAISTTIEGFEAGAELPKSNAELAMLR